MQHIRLEVHEKQRVGVLVMDYRGENRFHPDFMREMRELLDEVEKDRGLKALVVTGGEPKFWSNGLDLEWLMAHMGEAGAVEDYLRQVNELFLRWTLYPKPTVAALNGHTFAAGFFLAAHMDFRLMRADRGWICLPEVDIDIPLLPGMIAICRAVLPPASFHQLYYTGGRFTGPQAVAMGFVEEALPAGELLPRAIDFAVALGRKRTQTYAEMKRRIRGEVGRILAEEDPKHFAGTLRFVMS